MTNTISVSTNSADIVFRNNLGNGNVEDCASQFYQYSAKEVRYLEKCTLHDLLSSRSLCIKSEDELLRTLIDLGSDYYEFWSYIEVVFLSEDESHFLLTIYDFLN
jgi:hypothetical protein